MQHAHVHVHVHCRNKTKCGESSVIFIPSHKQSITLHRSSEARNRKTAFLLHPFTQPRAVSKGGAHRSNGRRHNMDGLTDSQEEYARVAFGEAEDGVAPLPELRRRHHIKAWG